MHTHAKLFQKSTKMWQKFSLHKKMVFRKSLFPLHAFIILMLCHIYWQYASCSQQGFWYFAPSWSNARILPHFFWVTFSFEEKSTQLFVFVFSVIGLVYSFFIGLVYSSNWLVAYIKFSFAAQVSDPLICFSRVELYLRSGDPKRLQHIKKAFLSHSPIDIYCLAPYSGSPTDVWMCRLFRPLPVIALTENVESIKMWMKEFRMRQVTLTESTVSFVGARHFCVT